MIESNPSYSNKQVIAYEDNPIWAKTLVLWLNHYGFGNVRTFNNKKCMACYIKDNHEKIDLCLIDFYDQEGDTQQLIKEIREISKDLLIIAMSADFVNDREVLDTKEMVKTIYAGANRATFKDIKHLKMIIDEDLTLRSLDNYEDIKTDPQAFLKSV